MVKKSIKKLHTLRAGGLFVSLDNENKRKRALLARGELSLRNLAAMLPSAA
jgi:hypothetical protein